MDLCAFISIPLCPSSARGLETKPDTLRIAPFHAVTLDPGRTEGQFQPWRAGKAILCQRVQEKRSVHIDVHDLRMVHVVQNGIPVIERMSFFLTK